jgi:hypothetical protein
MWTWIQRISTASALAAGSVGVLDLSGIGRWLLSQFTSVPLDAFPQQAPLAFQFGYWTVLLTALVVLQVVDIRNTTIKKQEQKSKYRK